MSVQVERIQGARSGVPRRGSYCNKALQVPSQQTQSCTAKSAGQRVFRSRRLSTMILCFYMKFLLTSNFLMFIMESIAEVSDVLSSSKNCILHFGSGHPVIRSI